MTILNAGSPLRQALKLNRETEIPDAGYYSRQPVLFLLNDHSNDFKNFVSSLCHHLFHTFQHFG